MANPVFLTEEAITERISSAKDALNARIDLIEATSHPNMGIVGAPKFTEGVVSGFSANDYLVFPTEVSVGENAVDFFMSFTTGANVTTQQNILDSWCGLAFAIQNGGTVTAASQNGTTFVTATSANTIAANTAYRLKLEFRHNGGAYTVTTKLATGSGEYSQIGGVVTLTAPVHPTATYWGGANPTSGVSHVFGGSINLAECRMDWNGKTVWRGYTEVPTYSKGVRDDGSPADEELHGFFTESNDLLTNRVNTLTAAKANSVSVAPEFDSTKTYAVDEMVMHGGNLYRCTTAVTTAGAWNAANWTQDTATHGDTAFLRDAQGHLVIRETEGHGGAQPQTLYVDAYRLAQDTVTHVIKDATINEIGEMADGVTLALPPAVAGHSRDFAVELKIGATVPSFVFPLVEADLKPYSDPIPTWAANTVYCISFTEFPDGKWRLGVASKEVTA